MDSCYFHSSKESACTCCRCHKKICTGCTIEVEGVPYCQVCWDGYVLAMQQKLDELEPEDCLFRVPWQRRHEIGPFRAFWQTAGEIVFHPSRFFALLPAGKDMLSPFFFALICILVFWYPMNLFTIKVLLPALMHSSQSLAADVQQSALFSPQAYEDLTRSLSVFEIILMPFSFLVFQVFLMSWLQQGLVTLLQGKQGFEATFQIRCYATVVYCLNLIPIVGIFLAELGSLLLCTRGFQVTQSLPLPRAFLIAAVPVMLTVLPNLWALL